MDRRGPLGTTIPALTRLWLERLHRWLGGVFGLLLALLGLSGAVLVHKDTWVSAPYVAEARVSEPRLLASATSRMMGESAQNIQSVLYASDSFGLNRLTLADGSGAYARQDGQIVARWSSHWDRPELWLFEFHHYLYAGKTGETIVGFAGVLGIFFVLSGVVLWWRTRATFAFRVWPARLTRVSIVRHHRDLGIVAAPLLLLSVFTGAVFVFRPVINVVFGPGAASEVTAALAPPAAAPVSSPQSPDWSNIIHLAHKHFPEAELRFVGAPKEGVGLITVRMRQPEEWLPNGRTTLWFSAADGRLIEARDSRALAPRVQAFNLIYPLHAAKVGGWPYKLIMTLSGFALTMLGLLATSSFWFAPRKLTGPRSLDIAPHHPAVQKTS